MKIKGDRLLIEGCISNIIKKFGKAKWTSDNKAKFTKGKTIIGEIVISEAGDKFSLEVKGTKLINYAKEVEKQITTITKKPLTELLVKNSVFKKMWNDKDKYNGLVTNPMVFDKINKAFSKVGIDEFDISASVSRGQTIQTKLKVIVNPNVTDGMHVSSPDGYYTRLKTFLFDKFDTSATSKDNLRCFNERTFVKPMIDEEAISIEIKGMEVGKYFRERNFIELYFNPFQLKPIYPLDTKEPEIITELTKAFDALKLTNVKVDKIKERIFISSFLENSEKRLKEIDSSLKSEQQQIKSWEKEIANYIRNISNQLKEKVNIEENLRMNGKNLFSEIKEVQKMPFITNVKIDGDKIRFDFAPACLKFKDFRPSDHGKSFGQRTAYLGNISVEVRPGQFKIINKETMNNGHPHTHADTSGSPCFGSGDGRNKIYEMLASNKFTDLSKLLWFRIKTHIDDGSYIKSWDFVNDRLQQGYPVWDENGKRIEINDPSRIKSKEQHKLEKQSNYTANLKKFKDFKIC